MIGIAVMNSFVLAVIILDFVTDKVKNTSSKKINRVHFYVARDKDGSLWLYIGKPYRVGDTFFGNFKKGSCIISCRHLEILGLNENDYKDLKWEDEPVEVFLNMED